MSNPHDEFMRLAIEEAWTALRSGERPFGSVIVRDKKVVGRGRNIVNSTGDPTAHAETSAIRDATAKLKTPKLNGCTLYTSCHPCPMCAGATLYSGADSIVIGVSPESLKRISGGIYDLKDYDIEKLVKMIGLKLEVVTGVLEKEANEVFEAYQDWDVASPNLLRPN